MLYGGKPEKVMGDGGGGGDKKSRIKQCNRATVQNRVLEYQKSIMRDTYVNWGKNYVPWIWEGGLTTKIDKSMFIHR